MTAGRFVLPGMHLIKSHFHPSSYSLNEVVVKPKREHYRKKDNPAVEFVRHMIKHRDDHSPDEKDFWQSATRRETNLRTEQL